MKKRLLAITFSWSILWASQGSCVDFRDTLLKSSTNCGVISACLWLQKENISVVSFPNDKMLRASTCSAADIVYFLRKNGLMADAVRCSFEELRTFKTPLIIHLALEGDRKTTHFSLITRFMEDNDVIIEDPLLDRELDAPNTISASALEKNFTGYAIISR